MTWFLSYIGERCQHGGSSNEDENYISHEDVGVDPSAGSVKQPDQWILGFLNLLQVIPRVDDLVPDVGDPQTGKNKGQEDKKNGIADPERHVKAFFSQQHYDTHAVENNKTC